MLFFDECDALFGKRSEVKDAHDRYANIEVGYLLQRIETYDGIAILATNLRGNMDPAFIRRIRFMLDFPMPDAAMRCRLGNSRCRADYRAPDLDLGAFVDRFRLSGGSIQNISLAAAHMAAATPDGRITVQHLVRATYRELENRARAMTARASVPWPTISLRRLHEAHHHRHRTSHRPDRSRARRARKGYTSNPRSFRVLGERLDRTPFGQFGEARTYTIDRLELSALPLDELLSPRGAERLADELYQQLLQGNYDGNQLPPRRLHCLRTRRLSGP